MPVLPFRSKWHRSIVSRFTTATICILAGRVLTRFGNGFDGRLAEGEAVMNHSRYERYRGQQPFSGGEGHGFLTSYHPDKGDRATGRKLSRAFTTMDGQCLAFLITGGKGKGAELCLQLELFDDETGG